VSNPGEAFGGDFDRLPQLGPALVDEVEHWTFPRPCMVAQRGTVRRRSDGQAPAPMPAIPRAPDRRSLLCDCERLGPGPAERRYRAVMPVVNLWAGRGCLVARHPRGASLGVPARQRGASAR
jgi:hypothetical protein